MDGGLGRSRIEVGFHYLVPGVGDRQASGVLTGFSGWTAEREDQPERDLLALGIRGHIGDRDHFELAGFPFDVQEAQAALGDWSSWHPYLYDRMAGAVVPLHLHTHAGSTSFGNPTVSTVTGPDGRPALVMTDFVFYEGAAVGESGPLVYYRAL
jgi:hypothetical protein